MVRDAMAAGAPGPSEGLGAIGARFATAGRLGAIPASAARIFKAYEAQSYAELTQGISKVRAAEGIPEEALSKLLEKIYRRKM